MERDRYAVNHRLYVIGMGSLLASILLILLAVYIVPKLFWNWNYDVPDFISVWQYWLITEKGWSERTVAWWLFATCMVPGMVLAVLSSYISNRLDEALDKLLPEKDVEVPDAIDESVLPWEGWISIVKLMFMALVILLVIGVLQFF